MEPLGLCGSQVVVRIGGADAITTLLGGSAAIKQVVLPSLKLIQLLSGGVFLALQSGGIDGLQLRLKASQHLFSPAQHGLMVTLGKDLFLQRAVFRQQATEAEPPFLKVLADQFDFLGCVLSLPLKTLLSSTGRGKARIKRFAAGSKTLQLLALVIQLLLKTLDIIHRVASLVRVRAGVELVQLFEQGLLSLFQRCDLLGRGLFAFRDELLKPLPFTPRGRRCFKIRQLHAVELVTQGSLLGLDALFECA